MNMRVLVAVEEHLNNLTYRKEADKCTGTFVKFDPAIVQLINTQLMQDEGTREPTIYEDVIVYIKRLNNTRFLRQNGEVKEAPFYQYAYIDKSTWSELKWNQVIPSKKTLLKLILALKLDKAEAEALMVKGQKAFNLDDFQDRVILAVIGMRNGEYEIDIDDIIEILDYYRTNGPRPFDSIYETPEMIAGRKKMSSG